MFKSIIPSQRHPTSVILSIVCLHVFIPVSLFNTSLLLFKQSNSAEPSLYSHDGHSDVSLAVSVSLLSLCWDGISTLITLVAFWWGVYSFVNAVLTSMILFKHGIFARHFHKCFSSSALENFCRHITHFAKIFFPEPILLRLFNFCGDFFFLKLMLFSTLPIFLW